MTKQRSQVTRLMFGIRKLYGMGLHFVRVFRMRLLGMHIGRAVQLGKIEASIPESVKLGDYCVIESGVRFYCAGPWLESNVHLSDRVFIGSMTQLNIGSSLDIGADVMIAAGCIITDAHHNFKDINRPIQEQGVIHTPIVIENDVWIGSRVVILRGVKIGKGSVVAAGAVVNKSIPPYEVWGGVPARKIRNRV